MSKEKKTSSQNVEYDKMDFIVFIGGRIIWGLICIGFLSIIIVNYNTYTLFDKIIFIFCNILFIVFLIGETFDLSRKNNRFSISLNICPEDDYVFFFTMLFLGSMAIALIVRILIDSINMKILLNLIKSMNW